MLLSAVGPGVLAALLATAPATAPASSSPSGLSIAWTDFTGLPVRVQEVAMRELRTVLSEAGIEVKVRRRPPDEELDRPQEIALALVPGPTSTPRGADVLGAVLRTPMAQPIAWIHLRAIRRTLGHSPETGAALPMETRELALAIGRVAAHEVVHLVLPGHPHTATGLMAERLGRAALTGSSIHLDLATRQAVCAATSSPTRS